LSPTATTDRRSAGQRRRRERERLARCVLTHSGKRLDLREPDPSLIALADISHGLAWCRRFAGTGISVAEHSVIVCRRLRDLGEPPDVQLAGLLHDAAEAFTGDVIRPVKSLIRGHRKLEDRLDAAILAALALPADLPLHSPVVKAADVWALGVERGRRDPMAAGAARKAFTREYRRLTS
jgi:hypothetical protein